MAEGVAKEQLMVTEREAAKLLGLCARSLWSLRHSGEIPFVRVGRAVRYRVESLRKWCAERETLTLSGIETGLHPT